MYEREKEQIEKIDIFIGWEKDYLLQVEQKETMFSDNYKRLKSAYDALRKAYKDAAMSTYFAAADLTVGSGMKVDPYIAGGAGSGMAGLAGGVMGYSAASNRNASIDRARASAANDRYARTNSLNEGEILVKRISEILRSIDYMREYVYNAGCRNIRCENPTSKTIKEGILQLEIVGDYNAALALMPSARQKLQTLTEREKTEKEEEERRKAAVAASGNTSDALIAALIIALIVFFPCWLFLGFKSSLIIFVIVFVIASMVMSM